LVENSGVPLACCGENMTELIPNTVEASIEKHLPVANIADNILTVEVGSTPHPMTAEHHILIVCIESQNSIQCKHLTIHDAPSMEFCLSKDKPKAVYAYCNLHGLWKTQL